MRIDLPTLEREITSLFEAYPELADDEELRAGMLEGSTEIMDVLARLLAQMLDAEAMAEAIASRRQALAERLDRFDRREKAARTLLFKLMGIAGLRKAELPEATLSVRAVAPGLVIADEADIPDEFWRVSKAINKTAIKDALKAGQFVPGASLDNGGETLSVRIA